MLPSPRTFQPVLHNSREARNCCIGNDTFVKPICNTIEMSKHRAIIHCINTDVQHAVPEPQLELDFLKILNFHCIQMNLIYSMLSRMSNKTVRSMSVAKPVALCNYYRFIREVIEDDLLANPVQIGGSRVIVEIGETKLEKRKYNRGNRVESAWVFGCVERTVVVREDGSTW